MLNESNGEQVQNAALKIEHSVCTDSTETKSLLGNVDPLKKENYPGKSTTQLNKDGGQQQQQRQQQPPPQPQQQHKQQQQQQNNKIKNNNNNNSCLKNCQLNFINHN